MTVVDASLGADAIRGTGGASQALLPRTWELPGALSAYDAAHIELAERLVAVLLTRDSVLARAAGVHCKVQLII